MESDGYKVFVSHGSHDVWVAGQIAKSIREIGAAPFLDETDIPKGSNYKQIIHREIGESREIVALFTPWSKKRSWVWVEIGAAWIQDKPVVAVFYGMEVSDLEVGGQGKAILEDINILKLNDVELYLQQLAGRINEAKHE